MKRALLTALLLTTVLSLSFSQYRKGSVGIKMLQGEIKSPPSYHGKTDHLSGKIQSSCDKINLPAPGSWTATNYYTGNTVGEDGWINGVNAYDDKQKAMYFDESSSPYSNLVNVWVAFGVAYSADASKLVTIRIYDGSTGNPTTELANKTITMGQIMSDKNNGAYSSIYFQTPVQLPASKKFFVSVDVTNLCWNCANKDTLSIVSNSNGQTVPSAIWEQQSDNNWYQYGTAGSWNLSASLYIHPFLTDEPTIATFIQDASVLCSGNALALDATGSTYEDTLLWSTPGGSPSVTPDSVTTKVTYDQAGTYPVILYVVGGGCDLFDSLASTVTIKASPDVAVNVSPAVIYAGDAATLTASGASSYAWSPSDYLSATTGDIVTATPDSGITYTVTGQENGCYDSALAVVVVKQPEPVITGATDVNSSRAVIHWDPAANATSYSIYLYRTDTARDNYRSTTDNFKKFYVLRPGTHYFIQVRSICFGGRDSSDWSAPFEFVTDDYCLAPTGLNVADVEATQVRLNWDMSPAASIDLWLRYRPVNDVNWNYRTIPASQTSQTIKNLTTGIRYEWQMKSFCNNDTSNWVRGHGFVTHPSSFGIESFASAKNNLQDNATIEVLPNPNKGHFAVRVHLPAKKSLTTVQLLNGFGQVVWEQDLGLTGGLISQDINLENRIASGLYVLAVKQPGINYTTKIMVTK